MRVSDTALSERANEIAADPRLGAGSVEAMRRVLVDYAGPNVAKPMHVGHLRSSIIGEAIKRIYRFRGDMVVGDAHFGDWGYQMGLLIGAVMDETPFVKALMEQLNGRTTAITPEEEKDRLRRPGEPDQPGRSRPALSGGRRQGKGRH